jgi:hypothetical protein
MLKKTITYTDFNDEETTEVFFFNLSRAELVELEMSREGGFVESMKRIIAADDNQGIVKEMKNIILMSYGKKSPDGKKFIKSQALRDEFEASEAYSTLFMELATNAEAAIQFFNGIIPAGLAEEAAKLQRDAGTPGNGMVSTTTDKAVSPNVPKRLTLVEAREMNSEELSAKLASGEVVIGEK